MTEGNRVKKVNFYGVICSRVKTSMVDNNTPWALTGTMLADIRAVQRKKGTVARKALALKTESFRPTVWPRRGARSVNN